MIRTIPFLTPSGVAHAQPAAPILSYTGSLNTPTLHANGKIAFTSDRDGNREIYVMNPDGSNQIRTTNNTLLDDHPTWSPDGTKMAFVCQKPSGAFALCIMNPDGTNKVEVTPLNNYRTWFANFSTESWSMSWSPDGNRIAFQDNSDILVVNADGSNRRQVTDSSDYDGEPSWSPDGSRILFSSARVRAYPSLYTVKPDGTDLQAFPGFVEGTWEIAPDWSPLGDKVLFVSDYSDNIPISVISTENADGTNRQLFEGSARDFTEYRSRNKPSWSPDGSKIIFDMWEYGTGDMEIYVKNIDGSGFVQLTNTSGWNRHPSWQPLLSAACPNPIDCVPSWSQTGSLNTPRSGNTVTVLPNGKVLVAGGGASRQYFDSAELYDPATGTWSYTGSLNTSRAGHSATLLQNGKVLVVGGYTANLDNNISINTAELYDPVTGVWSYTGSLNILRNADTATLLKNGKVLIAGGADSGQYVSNVAELYDPATGTWSLTGRLNTRRGGHTATLLQNGNVLVAGGQNDADFSEYITELYDPTTGTWSVTGRLNAARGGHTATLLPNGKVLIAGACNEGIYCGSRNSSSELYNPATGTWSVTGELNTPRFYHAATLLPDGQVLIAGGKQINFFSGTEVFLNSAEIYDPASGNWTTTASLNASRSSHGATLLQNGKVMVVGGWDATNNGPLRSAELYGSGSSPAINPIDDPQFFVRQHYRDFLSREPDAPGLAHWADEITACDDPSRRQPGESLALCIERKRTNTSAAFFLSPEFQYTGYFVYRLYKGSLIQNGAGRFPTFQEFVADVSHVAQGIVQNNQLSASIIEANKKKFAEDFIKRAEFRNLYNSLSNFDYVERLFQTTGINVSAQEKQALVAGLNNQTETRASVLLKVVDGAVVIAEGNQQFTTTYGKEFYDKEFNAAFVLMEYFGYLRRDPDAAGYKNWLDKLNIYGNYIDAEMVKSFIVSPEYRSRFGQP